MIDCFPVLSTGRIEYADNRQILFGARYYDSANRVAKKPAKRMRNIRPMKEIAKPAMDRPRGVLNTPIKENIAPNAHKIHPITGTHPKNMAKSAHTKPATPSPLLCCCRSVMMIVCPDVLLPV